MRSRQFAQEMACPSTLNERPSGWVMAIGFIGSRASVKEGTLPGPVMSSG